MSVQRFALKAALFCAALAPVAVCAGDFSRSAKGTASALFLKLDPSARAAAMGGAYSALVDGSEAVTWNPAGLGGFSGRSATLTHAAYVAGSFFNHAAYTQNISSGQAIGVAVRYFSAGDVTERDTAGTATGELKPNDVSAAVAYGKAYQGWKLGIAWKFIRSTLKDSAQTAATDLGGMSPDLWNGRVRLALSAQNLGGTLRYETESERLPAVVRLGSAWKLSDQWRATADVAAPIDNAPYVSAGTEYDIWSSDEWVLALRSGLNTRTAGELEGLSTVSMGFGASYRGVKMDYAFVPMGDLDITHRITLGFDF